MVGWNPTLRATTAVTVLPGPSCRKVGFHPKVIPRLIKSTIALWSSVPRWKRLSPPAHSPPCRAASDAGSISTQTSRWFDAASTAGARGSSGAGQITPLAVTRKPLAGQT